VLCYTNLIMNYAKNKSQVFLLVNADCTLIRFLIEMKKSAFQS